MTYTPQQILSAPKGWQCPKCGRIYAPETPECQPCNKPGNPHTLQQFYGTWKGDDAERCLKIIEDNQSEIEIDDLLDQIKEMLEKIPAGEWINHGCFAQCGQVWSISADYPVAWCDTRECGEGPNQEQIQNVANFIAASPAIVRKLLEKIETLKELLELQCKESWKEELKLQNVALEQENEHLRKIKELKGKYPNVSSQDDWSRLQAENVALEQENEELKKMVEALYQVGLKNAR